MKNVKPHLGWILFSLQLTYGLQFFQNSLLPMLNFIEKAPAYGLYGFFAANLTGLSAIKSKADAIILISLCYCIIFQIFLRVYKKYNF